jgi:hypothetical protein
MRERIERGMSVEPLPWPEHAKNGLAFVFVVGMTLLFVVLIVLFIARLF